VGETLWFPSETRNGASTAQYVLGPSSNSRLRTAVTPSRTREKEAFLVSAEAEVRAGVDLRDGVGEPRADLGGSWPGGTRTLGRVLGA
jgi:hypothetical protein